MGRPTSADAIDALARGDEQRADIEGRALRSLAIDDEGGKQVLDALHLAEVKRTKGTKEQASVVRREWFTVSARTEAIAVLTGAAAKEADAAQMAQDDSKLDAIAKELVGIDDRSASVDRVRAGLVRVKWNATKDYVESGLNELRINSSDAPPVELEDARKALIASIARVIHASAVVGASRGALRVIRLERAAALSKSFADLTGGASSPTPDEIQVALGAARADAAAEAVQAAKDKAIADAKQKQEEATRKATEAAEAAREHEASRSLLCCDGTESPSCLCHAGSHQGCCSHHHGVCGCAP